MDMFLPQIKISSGLSGAADTLHCVSYTQTLPAERTCANHPAPLQSIHCAARCELVKDTLGTKPSPPQPCSLSLCVITQSSQGPCELLVNSIFRVITPL